jgi:hypothetical protein
MRIEKLEKDVASLQQRPLLSYGDRIALKTQSSNEQHYIGTISGSGTVTTLNKGGQQRSAPSPDETFLIDHPNWK